MRELFAQTSMDNLALRLAKLTAFGVPDGRPIMYLKTHSCFTALNSVYDGEAELSALVVFETEEGHASGPICSQAPSAERVYGFAR